MNIQRYPAHTRGRIKGTKNKTENVKTAYLAEQQRKKRKKTYEKYKNEFFLKLFIDATDYRDLTSEEKKVLRLLCNEVDEVYNIPINFYATFVYKTTYEFFSWGFHQRSNVIGFFINNDSLRNFSYWLSGQTIQWRKKCSFYPSEYGKNWGIKIPVANQKLGLGEDKVYEQYRASIPVSF